jgi:hypothetical protein
MKLQLQRRPVSDPHVIRPKTAIASCVKHMLHSRAPAYREFEEIAGPRELPDRRFSLHKIPQFPTVIAAMDRPFVLCGEGHFRGMSGNQKRGTKRREINPPAPERPERGEAFCTAKLRSRTATDLQEI